MAPAAADASGRNLVVDIGKTLSKVSLWSGEGDCLARATRPNAVRLPSPYVALDVNGVGDWLVATLGEFSKHPIEAIIPVAHGAAVAAIKDGALAFAPMDYEWEIPPELATGYRAERDAFALTGSPALPLGLNLGSQLHYLSATRPAALAGAVLLPYAQYWAWFLSGVAVSEATSLGCHSDLWAPGAGDFSALAKRRGWADQFAPLARAGDAIGTLRPDLAVRTGLSPHTRIHAGLHDSNAALLAARGFAEIADQEATVLSTGTWFIAMRSTRDALDPATLDEARDSLVNIDAFGAPTPSARYMGGREIDMLGARIDRPGTDGAAQALRAGAMLLPSFAPGGPFPHAAGGWLNEPTDAAARIAAIALYAALMSDAALDLIGAKDRLLIEGRFAASEIFTRALASLRPHTRVFAQGADADASFGALRLIEPELKPQGALKHVRALDLALDLDLSAYRARWRAQIENRR